MSATVGRTAAGAGIVVLLTAGAVLCGSALGRVLPTGRSHRLVVPRGLAAPAPHEGVTSTRAGRSPFEGPRGGRVAWSIDLGERPAAGPLVGADDSVYVLSTARSLWAISPDGATLWRTALGGGAGAPTWLALGPGGIVILAETGALRALSSEGTPLWRLSTGAAVTSSTPLVDPDGVLWVALADRRLIGVTATGRVASELHLPAAPATGTSPFAQASSGVSFCRSRSGAFFVATPDGGVHVLVAGAPARSLALARTAIAPPVALAPVALGGGGVVVPTNGSLVWISEEATSVRDLALPGLLAASGTVLARDDLLVVALGGGEVRGLGADGAARWTQRWRFNRAFAVADHSGTTYVAADDGRLTSVGADGTVGWRVALGGNAAGAPAIGSDGTVYVATVAGALSAVR